MKPLVLALALLMSPPAEAPPPLINVPVVVVPAIPIADDPNADVQSFEVVRAGIYESEVLSSRRDAMGILQNATAGEQLLYGTTRIPAKIGVDFGLDFKVTGVPDGAWVTLRVVTRYPEPGATPPGAAKPILTAARPLHRRLNQESHTGYLLQEPWELIPGKWAIEFWLGDRKLGEQEFTLVVDTRGDSFSGELFVEDLEGAYVGHPPTGPRGRSDCHDLILSERMKRQIRGRTDAIFELDGSYVPDAPDGVVLERVGGRRWHGRKICREPAIFVNHIRLRK